MKNSVLFLKASSVFTFSFFREKTLTDDPVGSSFLHCSRWPLALIITWMYTDPPRVAEQRDVLWMALHFVSAAGKKPKNKGNQHYYTILKSFWKVLNFLPLMMRILPCVTPANVARRMRICSILLCHPERYQPPDVSVCLKNDKLNGSKTTETQQRQWT